MHCGNDILNTLQEKVVLFNQEGQEYKMISDNLYILKNTVVKIISNYSNDKNISRRDVYYGCQGKLELKI